MKKKITLRLFSAFAGIDTQYMGALRYHEYHNHHNDGCLIEFKLVGWCEIDEYAIKSHNVLFPEAKELHYPDITKIEWSKVPDFDILVYSSCCQSISRAGAQKGMTEGSGTPSSLIWYVREAIKIKRPKFCILENVPALLESKFEGQFEKWTNTVAKFGYRNTWSTLCAADFGVPQNRNRVFLVSVRNDIEKKIYFPTPIGCEVSAEALLDSNVDKKYYFSEEVATAFVLSINDKKVVDKDLPQIHVKGKCVKKIITPSCKRYDFHVCPTLVADKNYSKVSYYKILSSTHYPRPGVLEVWRSPEKVKVPYNELISKSFNETKRKFKIINASKYDIIDLTKNLNRGEYLRFRRLTPSECFRLMGVNEENIIKLTSSGVPEGQLYKMAGNAIVVDTLFYLYKSLFSDIHEWY